MLDIIRNQMKSPAAGAGTPDQLKGDAAKEVMAISDEGVKKMATALDIQVLIGVGGYAEKRCQIVAADFDEMEVDAIPHPSPASPFANRNGGADWRAAVASVLHRWDL